MLWLFLNGNHLSVLVELSNAIAFGVVHVVAENNCAVLNLCSIGQLLTKTLAVEDIIAKNKANLVITNKFLTENECLRKSIGRRLNLVVDVHTELRAVTEKLFV